MLKFAAAVLLGLVIVFVLVSVPPLLLILAALALLPLGARNVQHGVIRLPRRKR